MDIYKSAEGERQVEAQYRSLLSQWPIPNRQSRVPTRHGTTFVVVCGPDTAPPVVLLHGAYGNAAMWIFDVPTWAAHFRLYVVDVIGEAGLSARSRPPLASDAYAHWLDDVMQGLGLSRAAFIGESLGGWLALDYATRRPERVASLALLCPGGVGRTKNFLLRALPLMFLGSWGQRKLRDQVLGEMSEQPPAELQRFLDFMALIWRHFIPRMEKLPIFSDEALQRLTMPVLAIVGGRDVLLDSAQTQERLERNVANVKVDYRADLGHLITGRTEPILEFLRTTIEEASHV
jgi:pimeloyl-ACP methyl ester carboxylesterase